MMESILSENLISFKKLEQEIYDFVCLLGRETTKIILESYDDDLAKSRDKETYRNKGKRKTTIKTVYGEVSFARRVYQTKTEEGQTAHVYLLDEAMHMDKIGLISTNLAEKIAMAAAEFPFRKAASTISGTCGQTISHGGVWSLIQQLGDRSIEEEEHLVRRMDAGETEGKKSILVLFEEMDGVWLNIQGEGHKMAKSQEMKICTIYEGWDEKDQLVNRKMLAGMEGSAEFHHKREAFIENEYDAAEIGQRVLNGDGGAWIKEPYDPEAIIQLDRFHIHQGIKRYLKDKEAQQAVTDLFRQQKVEEMLEYILIYADSVESDDPKDTRSRDARKLYGYLDRNRDFLLPYTDQGISIPEPKEGVIYKNMGVQESLNFTLITNRMKNGRMRWSELGADKMAKVLCLKENRALFDTIERYTDGLIFNVPIKEVIKNLSAARSPKTAGKGSTYPERINCHMPLRDAAQTASSKAMLHIYD